jgi:hypothetical protein
LGARTVEQHQFGNLGRRSRSRSCSRSLHRGLYCFDDGRTPCSDMKPNREGSHVFRSGVLPDPPRFERCLGKQFKFGRFRDLNERPAQQNTRATFLRIS